MNESYLLQPQEVMRTFYASCHIAGEGELPALVAKSLSLAISSVGKEVQEILAVLERAMQVESSERGVQHVDLEFPCKERDRERAKENVSKHPRPPLQEMSPRQAARPNYKNSYRLEEVEEREGVLWLRFRIAERYSWQGTRGESKGKYFSKLDIIPAKFFQQVIMSWMRPELDRVPTLLRAGVCQQASQQFLSHVGLLEYGKLPRVSYPSLKEREPVIRKARWENALGQVSRKIESFSYEKAREIFPWRYREDDPRGDRLINIDPAWIELLESPLPQTLPLNFVTSDAVVVYERNWEEECRNSNVNVRERKRLYAALPLFEGVNQYSPLGRLRENQKPFWWWKHTEEFSPLGAWPQSQLDPRRELLVVPLEYDPETSSKPSRFKKALNAADGRRINWSVLVERNGREKRWEIHFATSREITPILRPLVLGIHFTISSIFWALADRDGNILEEGVVGESGVLSKALEEKLRLEELQGALRWVGERKYAKELKRRTYEVCRRILGLAEEKNANLALEKIEWVRKRGGGKEANQRFSVWNYAQLLGIVKWLGLERARPKMAAEESNGDNGSVLTIREVSGYILQYTCPRCKARRQAKAEEEEAATWRKGEILHCRRCGFEGFIPADYAAREVALSGAKRLSELLS